MGHKIESLSLAGIQVIQPRFFEDGRGHFYEAYHREKYAQMGIACEFLQDNQSYSLQNVVRGLHAQLKKPQAKLVRVVVGEIFDVVVDFRPASPTFGRWDGVRLSGENRKQLYIPEGFLHGFCVLSDFAYVHYMCSDVYDPADEISVLWNDPDLAIEWPVASPIVSEKDSKAMRWKEAAELIQKTGSR